MSNLLNELFDNPLIADKIEKKLPHLFQLASMESQRNGKVGMEVGSTREKILIALLMHTFGVDAVNADLPITEPEVDIFVHNVPLSIKTVTTTKGRWGGGIKLVWSVDADTAVRFKNNYTPSCDMLLAQIQWDDSGYLYLFPKQAQTEIMNRIGKDAYMRLPKPGTNARGVELTAAALNELSQHPHTKRIKIFFKEETLDYKEVYVKWLNAWRESV